MKEKRNAMRTAVHNEEPLPVSHYWGLIKGIDRIQKLELATMIMESLRDEEAAMRKTRIWDPETGEYLNDETVQVIERVRNGEEPVYQFDTMEDFKSWCEAV